MNSNLLNLALEKARAYLGNHPEFYNYIHFTYVIQYRQILEWGVNKPGTPPTYFGYKSSAKIHSELAAFRKARGILSANKSFQIINVRLSRSGDTKLSRPCEICANWLQAVGCNQMWYSLPGDRFRQWPG